MKSYFPFFAVAAVITATCNANDVIVFQIDSRSSSVNGNIMLQANLPGALIGNYDETTNPDGTLTRPGIFGGSGNQTIDLDMMADLAGEIVSQPTGGYQLGLDFETLTVTIADFELDVLGGQPGPLDLSLTLNFATFRTFQPDSLFPGVPLTIPLGDGMVTVLSIQQSQTADTAQLIERGPNQYEFVLLVPVAITIASEFMGQPVVPPPFEMVFQLNGDIEVDRDQVIMTQSFKQMASDMITDIPGGEYSDLPFPIPTIIPPGQTANVLLTGEVDTISFELDLTAAWTAEGVISPFERGDLNGDGYINLLDVSPFVEAVVSGAFNPSADINCDATVDHFDIAPFIAILVGD